MRCVGVERLLLEKPHLFSVASLPGSVRVLEDFLVGAHLSALRNSMNGPWPTLDALRNRKFRRLLASAAGLPFWQAKISPELVRARMPLQFLSRLPITEKQELRAVAIVERTHNSEADRYGTLTGTSGSTGEPLQFYIDRRLTERQWALLARAAGLDTLPLSSLVQLWPTVNPNPLFRKGFFAAATPESFAAQKEQIYGALARPHIILHAFPSLLRMLLEFSTRDNIAIRPARIITSGEALAPELATLVSDAFRCPTLSYYGSRELSIMAYRCREGRFHENSEDVFFEVVSEEGGPVPAGEPGRLVVTGLNSRMAPFIRYFAGDHGFFYPDACPCGNPLRSFGLEGRAHEAVPIFLPRRGHVSPYRLTRIFNKRFQKIVQYQIEYYAQDAFRVYIIPSARYSDADGKEIMHEFAQETGCAIEIRCVASIASEGAKVLPYRKTWH